MGILRVSTLVASFTVISFRFRHRFSASVAPSRLVRSIDPRAQRVAQVLPKLRVACPFSTVKWPRGAGPVLAMGGRQIPNRR